MRGPEWEGRDQDGGEEFVGTVVAVASAVGSEDHNDRGAGAGTFFFFVFVTSTNRRVALMGRDQN